MIGNQDLAKITGEDINLSASELEVCAALANTLKVISKTPIFDENTKAYIFDSYVNIMHRYNQPVAGLSVCGMHIITSGVITHEK